MGPGMITDGAGVGGWGQHGLHMNTPDGGGMPHRLVFLSRPAPPEPSALSRNWLAQERQSLPSQKGL